MEVLTRHDWGARGPARPYVRIEPGARPGVELHHTVGTYGVNVDAGGTAAAARLAREIQDDHLGRDWTDAFYNALVMPDGLVVELRPWDAKSGSVDRFTIVVPGNYDGRSLTAAQERGIRAVARHMRARGVGHDDSWHGARDSVGCPGENVIVRIREGLLSEEDDEVTQEQADRIEEKLDQVLAGQIGGRRNIGDDARRTRIDNRALGRALGLDVDPNGDPGVDIIG